MSCGLCVSGQLVGGSPIAPSSLYLPFNHLLNQWKITKARDKTMLFGNTVGHIQLYVNRACRNVAWSYQLLTNSKWTSGKAEALAGTWRQPGHQLQLLMDVNQVFPHKLFPLVFNLSELHTSLLPVSGRKESNRWKEKKHERKHKRNTKTTNSNTPKRANKWRWAQGIDKLIAPCPSYMCWDRNPFTEGNHPVTTPIAMISDNWGALEQHKKS